MSKRHQRPLSLDSIKTSKPDEDIERLLTSDMSVSEIAAKLTREGLGELHMLTKTGSNGERLKAFELLGKLGKLYAADDIAPKITIQVGLDERIKKD